MPVDRIPSDKAAAAADGDRLDSWKEIACYLGRDERTAQRWRRIYRMPVHHYPGNRRGRVYALPSELDAWLASRAKDSITPPPGALRAAPRPRTRAGWRRIAVLGLIAAAVTALALWLTGARASGTPAGVRFAGNQLEAYDDRGRALWNYELPGVAAEVVADGLPPFPRSFRMVEVAAEGTRELVGIAGYRNPGTNSDWHSALLRLSPDGALRHRYEPALALRFAGRTYSAPWKVLDFLPVQSGAPENHGFLVAVAHSPWWPSAVVRVLRDGTEQLWFVNAGWIYRLARLETPEGRFLLAGGTNNEYKHAALAVIAEPLQSGCSPQTPGGGFEPESCPIGEPHRYFLFPPTELNRSVSTHAPFVNRLLTGKEAVHVFTQETSGSDESVSAAIYEFGRDFRLRSVRRVDAYWLLHDRLQREGRINHSADTCPERVAPPLPLEWVAGRWRTLEIEPEAPPKK
jgi:hypothetical protein